MEDISLMSPMNRDNISSGYMIPGPEKRKSIIQEGTQAGTDHRLYISGGCLAPKRKDTFIYYRKDGGLKLYYYTLETKELTEAESYLF